MSDILDMIRMAKRRLLSPRDTALYEALSLCETQREAIEMQRAHIKALDARIAKLEHEAVGLRSLI